MATYVDPTTGRSTSDNRMWMWVAGAGGVGAVLYYFYRRGHNMRAEVKGTRPSTGTASEQQNRVLEHKALVAQRTELGKQRSAEMTREKEAHDRQLAEGKPEAAKTEITRK